MTSEPATISEAAIAIRGLTKRFGKAVALEPLDLDVPRGAVLGVLGPAGAGKSTLLRLLAGLALPSDGAVSVAGQELRFGKGGAARRRLGVVPQEPGLPGWMTARELLAFMANLAGVRDAERPARIATTAARLAIERALDRRIGELPAPTRGRLGIAQALVGDPEVLLLDEPFHWLDPEGRLEVRAILGELAGSTTVVLATHRLADVEGLCDRVALLDAGRLVVEGPTDAFLAVHAPPVFVLELAAPGGLVLDGLVLRLGREAWVGEAKVVGTALRVAVIDEARASTELLPAVIGTGVRVEGVRRARPSLDAVLAALRGDDRSIQEEHERSTERDDAGDDERNGAAA